MPEEHREERRSHSLRVPPEEFLRELQERRAALTKARASTV
jgi:hypothetical protein